MDIKDLKSQAYDCMAAIEHYQRQLQAINQKIAEASEAKDGAIEVPAE